MRFGVLSMGVLMSVLSACAIWAPVRQEGPADVVVPPPIEPSELGTRGTADLLPGGLVKVCLPSGCFLARPLRPRIPQ
jgi:hypothetical protein